MTEKGRTHPFDEGISTHTLTWSVTSVCIPQITARSISTHTLTWSVTCLIAVGYVNCVISTHTLTWSVTCCYP